MNPDVKGKIDSAAKREEVSCTNWGKGRPKLDKIESSKSDRDEVQYFFRWK